MGELLFNVLPSADKEGTVIVEADKEHLGTPAQPVADMKGRRTAAGELFLAVGTVMNFIVDGNIMSKHGDLLKIDKTRSIDHTILYPFRLDNTGYYFTE